MRFHPSASALGKSLSLDAHSSWCSRCSFSSFLLHDHVRIANIAKIANVANLNFGSPNVVQAKAAKTAYTPIATKNLFITTALQGVRSGKLVHRGGFEPP